MNLVLVFSPPVPVSLRVMSRTLQFVGCFQQAGAYRTSNMVVGHSEIAYDARSSQEAKLP
jgi:hypothetical protein